jgi:hypothetical protein
LVKRLAESERHAESGARLARSRWAVEIQDAAAILRLELAYTPHSFEISTALNRAQAGSDVVAHIGVEHEPIKLVVRLRLDEHSEIRGFAVRAVIATTRVAMVCRGRSIRWQGLFVFRHKSITSLSSFAPLAEVHR